MKRISYGLTAARVTLMAALVGMALVILAACGSSTTTDASAQPTAAPTAAMDMTSLPVENPTAATGGGVTDGTAPTAVPSDQTGGGATTEIQGTLAEWSLTLSQQEAPQERYVLRSPTRARWPIISPLPTVQGR